MNESSAITASLVIAAALTFVVWILGFYMILHGLKNTVDPFQTWGPFELVLGAGLVVLSPKISDRR